MPRSRILLTHLACASALLGAEPITLPSLLHQMVDREEMTRFPDPAFTTRLFSSYDRESVAPDKPDWYANGDFSQFLRVDSVGDHREAVLLDADGPGAIVRFWVTVAGTDGSGILRIYLDHAEAPVIEGKVLELLSGGKLCGAPLSTSVADATPYLRRGHDLYLPIPYARHCMVTYQSDSLWLKERKEDFFYNVETRTYERGVAVESFTLDILRRNAEAIAQANRRLAETAPPPAAAQSFAGTIPPGKSLVTTLTGPQAIDTLALAFPAGPHFDQSLRSTILEISFDGERTVWAPVGEFFGTGYQVAPHRTWYSSVGADGTMTAKWLMPFRETCSIALHNLGDAPVTLRTAAVSAMPYRWNDASMHFGAGWYELRRLPVRRNNAPRDENYVALAGQGILMGTRVTLFNTVHSWWGEGDEKVYVDGEAFPSLFGTGSEDYYGYAWCNGNPFEHPFLAQPEGMGAFSPGVVLNARYRALDRIAFQRGLRFDMEVFHHSPSTLINYAPATFWYMKPGGTATLGNDRIPLGDERIVAMAREPVATTRRDVVPMVPFGEGRLEGESMDGAVSAGRIEYIRGWGQGLSGGEQILWRDGKPEAVATFTFLAKQGGAYALALGLPGGPDYGKVEIRANGKVVIAEQDAFAETFGIAKQDAGTVELHPGENTLTVRLLGKKAKGKGYLFGIDYLELKKP